MAYKYLGGKTRRYLNTETGEEISRRQYDKIAKGINYEKKAAQNKQLNAAKAIARPARGRTAAHSQAEIDNRLAEAAEAHRQDLSVKAQKAAAAAAKKIRVKKIRPQLLKTGHRAARIPFNTWEEFEALRKEMVKQKLPSGKRLIASYSLGITGYDERTMRELDATLVTQQSPTVKISAEELEEMTDDFIYEHAYFIFSHYWLHLAFDREYAEGRAKKARAKNIPAQYRKK